MNESIMYDHQAMLDIVETEGLEYAITDYVRATRIADPVLQQLWNDAYVAIKQLNDYLNSMDDVK